MWTKITKAQRLSNDEADRIMDYIAYAVLVFSTLGLIGQFFMIAFSQPEKSPREIFHKQGPLPK